MSNRYSIWPNHTEGEEFQAGHFQKGFVHSDRAGGGYIIGLEAADMIHAPKGKQLTEKEEDRLRARLTTMLIDLREHGETYPLVTTGLVDAAYMKQPLVAHERADRLLQFVTKSTESVGEFILLSPSDSDAAMAWSESLDWEEVYYFLGYLAERGWLQVTSSSSWVMFEGQVTIDGYSRIEELKINVDSTQAFVAMWFDDSMNEAFKQGMESAVSQAGYSPMRIDRKEHINKIDDEIVAEIRRSRFLVADFTQGPDGARGGVYYEAGFAHGLGIPVIFTCHEKSVDTLHFDTNHYNHIVWTTPEELREKLKNRILAVIGEGPEVHKIL